MIAERADSGAGSMDVKVPTRTQSLRLHLRLLALMPSPSLNVAASVKTAGARVVVSHGRWTT